MQNQIKFFLSPFFRDYKIRSDKNLKYALVLTFAISVIFIFSDVLIDIPSSSINIQIAFACVCLFLIVSYKRNGNKKWIQYLYLTFLFLIVEMHFLENPRSFHLIVYWFCLIPVTAVIVSGLRQSIFWFVVVLVVLIANIVFLSFLLGSSYTVSIDVKAFLVVGVVFSVATFSSSILLYKLLGEAYNDMKAKSKELETLRNLSDAKKKKMLDYQKTLFSLSKDSTVIGGDFVKLYKKICKVAVEKLQITRVSIWIFDEKTSVLKRQYLYQTSGGTDEIMEITKEERPNYFQAILTKNFIAAEDAFTHPDTADFVEDYLKPLNIHALLDSPITLDGKPIGIICCENQDEFHPWTAGDILFVQSLSDFIALGAKSNQIRALLQRIRSQNRDLVEKRKQIEGYNEELSALNEELTLMNESLELTVQNRTSVLEQKNKQLREYAFINSHLLRAPLSRILGLSYIISKEKLNISDAKLLKALLLASEELDSIVRKISNLLYEGNDFSRQDIREIIERNMNGSQGHSEPEVLKEN